MRYKFLKEKAGLMIYLIISLVFTISIATPVAAEDEVGTNACCERTVHGDTCSYTDVESCDDNYEVKTFQRCEDTDICKIGCCVNDEEGSCSKQTSKATCESVGYTWHADETCQIDECKKGCCVLALSSCAYVTERKCEKIMDAYPELEMDFRDSDSEFECTAICKEKDEGCCVNDDNCLWSSRENCGMDDGTGGDGFYNEVYCSNEYLPCDCEKHGDGKHCLEGEDDVYWFDSCGNPEGIAEDCDYGQGTLCSEKDENSDEAYCETLDCEETWKDDANPTLGSYRFNGESWCAYDAKTGPTFDVVGSRHYRHICINGIEIVEPCKDYREEICIYGDVDNEDRREEMAMSACTTNRWKSCTEECNTAKDADNSGERRLSLIIDKKCCERTDLRNCVWMGDENNGVCMPSTASGLKFWDDSENGATPSAEAVDTCEAGDYETKVGWGKKLAEKDWDCKVNCEALKDDFLIMRNQYCRSLGDCGAHYNYIGAFTDEGFFREPLKVLGWELKPFLTEELVGDFDSEWKDSQGGLYLGKLNLGGWRKWGGPGSKWGDTAAGFSMMGVASAGVIVASVALAHTLAIGAGGGGALALYSSVPGALAPVAATSLAGLLLGIGIALLVAVILYTVLTWPQTKTTKVKVTCQPWQAPIGGDDCAKCDEDSMKQCSEYRCRSLGSQCRFIAENEGTGRETCVAVAINDVADPKIEWNDEAFVVISKREEVTSTIKTVAQQQGHKVVDKVPAHSKVTFGILTDETSQCYLDTEFKDPMIFSDLVKPFPDTYFAKEHNITYNNLLPDTTYRFYIGCKDSNNNPKEDEYIAPYVIELTTDDSPDMSAPYIISTELPKNGKVAADKNKTEIAVYVDEDSEFSCRLEKEDRDYELMTTDMACTEPSAESFFADYEICAAKFNVSEGTNTVYIRCQDNPSDWESNTNTESYVVAFEKTTPLVITAFGPSGELYEKDITLFVETTGGADNGRAICYFDSNIGAGQFGTTNASYSENVLVDMLAGSYEFNVTCMDFVGNKDNAIISFSSERDLDAPEIKNIYKQGNTIYLELNEPATCEYKNESFFFGSGTVTSINVKKHLFAGQEIYHVLCKDIFDNIMQEIILHLKLPKIEKVVKVGSSDLVEP
ncbi:MAG: hypothetical protein U9Q69_02355 [Nanoarchaeota archaeon]|nr:hypothetical protein [Nanoarchaeota archaeon]